LGPSFPWPFSHLNITHHPFDKHVQLGMPQSLM